MMLTTTKIMMTHPKTTADDDIVAKYYREMGLLHSTSQEAIFSRGMITKAHQIFNDSGHDEYVDIIFGDRPYREESYIKDSNTGYADTEYETTDTQDALYDIAYTLHNKHHWTERDILDLMSQVYVEYEERENHTMCYLIDNTIQRIEGFTSRTLPAYYSHTQTETHRTRTHRQTPPTPPMLNPSFDVAS
jgi:hypothetical protein